MTQLQIPFNEKLVPFSEGGSWEKFRDFAPNGLVPCLIDGEITVWDSLAIVEYLAEDRAQVWPAERRARAWARCASAEMHAGFNALRNICTMNCGVTIRLPEIAEDLTKDLTRIDELWQEGLNTFGGPFLAGKAFTAVDAFFAPVALRIQGYGLQLSAPAMGYVQRLLELPAIQSWIDDALQEPWRESDHEQELLDAGTIVEDRRVSPVSV